MPAMLPFANLSWQFTKGASFVAIGKYTFLDGISNVTACTAVKTAINTEEASAAAAKLKSHL